MTVMCLSFPDHFFHPYISIPIHPSDYISIYLTTVSAQLSLHVPISFNISIRQIIYPLCPEKHGQCSHLAPLLPSSLLQSTPPPDGEYQNQFPVFLIYFHPRSRTPWRRGIITASLIFLTHGNVTREEQTDGRTDGRKKGRKGDPGQGNINSYAKETSYKILSVHLWEGWRWGWISDSFDV